MKTRWTTGSDAGLDALEQLHRSLTVDMIMTPRARLRVCRRNHTASAVMTRNMENFSFLPVVDEAGRFLGLYQAERWFSKEPPQQLIGDDFELFSEELVIGADASIVDFVTRADQRPTRLVVSGVRVAGLVSLSDLQQLPVRAALFTLITCLEMAMAKRIEKEWHRDDPSGWLELLSDERQADILKAIRKAKKKDGFVSEIVLTHFSDKATIICKKGLVPGSASQLECNFDAIRELRNDLAHANYYAETPKAARNVCAVVRTILQINEDMLLGIENK